MSPSLRWVLSSLATRIMPLVCLSRRWTMPGRRSPPMPESLLKWWRRALTRVPWLRESSVAPEPAWTIMPAGLLMMARCLSSWRISRGMSSGKAWRGGGCGVPSISMDSPPWSFCLGLAGEPATRTWPCSMRSWTRARLMSGMAWARYWSRRRPAASGAAVKVWMWSSASSSKSISRTGMGSGVGSSTPRVARYSCLTVRRRWPLGSMFLDGMGDQLSGLERDETGGCDHAEGDPLDGIEEIAEWDGVGERLPEESEEVLRYSGGNQGGGDGVSSMAVRGEVTEEAEGDEGRGDGGVEGYWVEFQRGRRDGNAPGETGGEARVAALGEMS